MNKEYQNIFLYKDSVEFLLKHLGENKRKREKDKLKQAYFKTSNFKINNSKKTKHKHQMKIKNLDNDLKQKLQLCMLTFKLIKK